MKQRFGVFATLVFAGTLVCPESVQGQSEVIAASGLTITVLVYKWARVSPATLEKGEALAAEIFDEGRDVRRDIAEERNVRAANQQGTDDTQPQQSQTQIGQCTNPRLHVLNCIHEHFPIIAIAEFLRGGPLFAPQIY